MFTKKLVTPERVKEAHRLFTRIFPTETLYDEGTVDRCFSKSAENPPGPWHYWLWSLSTPEFPMGKFIGMSGIIRFRYSDIDSSFLSTIMNSSGISANSL